jgi:hypothetical protein
VVIKQTSRPARSNPPLQLTKGICLAVPSLFWFQLQQGSSFDWVFIFDSPPLLVARTGQASTADHGCPTPALTLPSVFMAKVFVFKVAPASPLINTST